MKSGMPPPTDSMRELMKMTKKMMGDFTVSCVACSTDTCVSCMDDRSLTALVVSQVRLLCFGEDVSRFRCSRCYWSTKPCTNPSCPNEVGVPTKRCGDCHIDRYCSVECQAAAYLDHIGRCKKIVAKRDAAAVAAAAKSDDGESE